MGYLNLNNYKDELKPYLHNSLEKRRQLEIKLHENIKRAFQNATIPIVAAIKNKKGNFKGIDEPLKLLIDSSKEKLNNQLQFIIYATLARGASIAFSTLSRLKIDEALFKNEALKKLQIKAKSGEMKVIGEAERAKTRDKNVIVKQEHLNVANKSLDIAKHTMEKKQLFNGKEFQLSSRVWDLSNNSFNEIKKIVESGIGMDCKKLAIALSKYAIGDTKPIKEYPNMMARLGNRFPPNLPFAAMRLARNELSEVYFRTALNDYKENPYIEAVQWLLSNNRIKMYEDRCHCNDIAYQDLYGLGHGIYPIDKVPSRPHVMCLCNVAPITSRKLEKMRKEGLKLGNVPTEEWFEKQELLLELELLQDSSKATAPYSLAKFEWLNKTKEEEKTLLLEDFKKVNPLFIEKLNTCKNLLIANIHYKDTPHYSINENKIYCDIFENDPRSIKAGFKTNMTGFLHEAGHFLDYNLSKDGKPLHDKMKNIIALLKKDALEYVNGIYRNAIPKNQFIPFNSLDGVEFEKTMQFYKKLSDIKQFDYLKLVANEILKNKYINSSISDLLEGLTQGNLAGKMSMYGHIDENNPNYWNNLTLKSEATAHSFEALGSGGKRLAAFKTVFPLTFSYFLKFL